MSAAATDMAATRPAVIARKRKRISGRSIAILAFLTICAAFFCVPLYVLLATSLKTMDEIRQGQIFALPATWTLDAWRYAWFEACSGITCDGLKAGFWNSVLILIPSLILSIGLAIVTGYALALWKVRWAGSFLFLLFICAFVPFQIIMYPLIAMTRGGHLRHDHGCRGGSCRIVLAGTDADLPQLLQGHSARDHVRRNHGFGIVLADLC